MNPTARLKVELPINRYKIYLPDGRAPKIGDVGIVDQGFTSADGLPMVLVCFPSLGANCMYEAEVYETELL